MGLGEAASYLKKVIRPSMVTATNKMQININILAGSSKINLTFFDGIFSLQLYVAVKALFGTEFAQPISRRRKKKSHQTLCVGRASTHRRQQQKAKSELRAPKTQKRVPGRFSLISAAILWLDVPNRPYGCCRWRGR